jgi:hypothetical protein
MATDLILGALLLQLQIQDLQASGFICGLLL